MKRILTWLITFTLCLGIIMTDGLEAKAAERIDGSYLLEEESSEGITNPITRGVYLKSGFSSIKKVGANSIAAGGDTIAQKTVSKVSITVEVQWLVDGSWKTLTTWSATKTNTTDVSTSKTLTVPSGHFYRVYCTHHANSDVSGSFTNGLFI